MLTQDLTLKMLSDLGLYTSDELDYLRFHEWQEQRCESPIERAFWSMAYFELKKRTGGELWPQYVVTPYRIDFALIRIPNARRLKVAIELDGHEVHKTKEQRDYDTARERHLLRHGWTVIRFTGRDIYHNLQKCINEAVEIVEEQRQWMRTR
jgi:very-short-patch-repair endonuclease